MKPRALKTERHHWWPESVSQFWTDSEGNARQLSWDGREICSPPKNFGSITNAHHIKFAEDSVWNSSFENIFGKADSQFPKIIRWIENLEPPYKDDTELSNRFVPQQIPENALIELSECLASLIIRSPVSRNKIKLTVEQYRIGLKEPKAGKTLIALNMRHTYDTIVRTMQNGGKFAFLFSNPSEFIFGDGLLHNFSTGVIAHFNSRCVVPFTPNIAIVYIRPTSYRPEPRLVSIRLNSEEVRFFNNTTQIYSKDFVFYRHQKPPTLDDFSCRQFREFQYHKHPFLDWLSENIAAYSLPHG